MTPARSFFSVAGVVELYTPAAHATNRPRATPSAAEKIEAAGDYVQTSGPGLNLKPL